MLNAISAILGFCLTSGVVFAVTINTNLPGTNPTVNNPGGWVANFYQFALLLGGLLAFGAIVYGGMTYTLSAGNPEKQSDAKSRITQALLGLTLLLGAYIVLNFLNPKLTNLQIDTYGLTAACQGTSCENPVPLDKDAMQKALDAGLDTYLAERAEQVRGKAADLDADADELEAEADFAATSVESDVLIEMANERRARAELMRREESVSEYFYKTTAAEQTNNVEEIKRLTGVMNASLDSGIQELKRLGDNAGAETLAIKKFTHNVYFDAQKAAATVQAAFPNKAGPFDTIDTAKAREAATNAVKDIGKRVREEAKRLGNNVQDPSVSEVFRWGAAATEKIRDACAAKNIKC